MSPPRRGRSRKAPTKAAARADDDSQAAEAADARGGADDHEAGTAPADVRPSTKRARLGTAAAEASQAAEAATASEAQLGAWRVHATYMRQKHAATKDKVRDDRQRCEHARRLRLGVGVGVGLGWDG